MTLCTELRFFSAYALEIHVFFAILKFFVLSNTLSKWWTASWRSPWVVLKFFQSAQNILRNVQISHESSKSYLGEEFDLCFKLLFEFNYCLLYIWVSWRFNAHFVQVDNPKEYSMKEVAYSGRSPSRCFRLVKTVLKVFHTQHIRRSFQNHVRWDPKNLVNVY